MIEKPLATKQAIAGSSKGRVALLVIDDGRGHLGPCWETVHANLRAGARRVAYDDLVVVDDTAHELGFDGAIREGWRRILELTPTPDFVFHMESDFVFNAPVFVSELVQILQADPGLAQVSLKRQAVNEREVAAGGLVEADPDAFVEKFAGSVYCEHSLYFTTNPSLYPVAMCHLGWPEGPRSEGRFTSVLRTYPLRFALWGPKFAPPRVEHVGVRQGRGY